MSGNHYRLTCLGCNETYEDSPSGFLLKCSAKHPPALLRADYDNKSLTIHPSHPGLFRYSDWLPVRRIPREAGGPVVFQSEALGRHLRLDNLFIAFSGYWPERGAYLDTCSFKELEAYATCARIPDGERRTMVVSSAGNTGMAFLQVCSENAIPVLVLVPEAYVPNLWITTEKHPRVILAALTGDVDYFDAIEVANRIGAMDDFYPEGGVHNIARRDGMGTVVLAAAERIGRTPDHYFQAVGSGTGGIAAWEMAGRLREDGRFGQRPMRLHFVQNSPFTIMTDAWGNRSAELPLLDETTSRDQVSRLYAPVLSNRFPPYSVLGGVFDALRDSRGYMYAAGEREAREAGALFSRLEGSDLNPAAEVALAGLIQAVAAGRIRRRETVLLNVTGGGSRRLELEGRKHELVPDLVIRRDDNVEQVVSELVSA